MEASKIISEIIKWELTGSGFETPYKDGEKAGFIVGRYLGDNRNCIITGDISITTENTTFILDIEVVSHIEFKTEKTPTQEEIYELYKQAKLKWNYEILIRSNKEGIKPMVVREQKFIPFLHLKDNIQKAIRQSLIQSN